jgi:hypothetical protein
MGPKLELKLFQSSRHEQIYYSTVGVSYYDVDE